MAEKISRELEERIVEIAKESRAMTLILSLRDIRDRLGIDISLPTIARVLYDHGIPPKGKPRSHKETDK